MRGNWYLFSILKGEKLWVKFKIIGLAVATMMTFSLIGCGSSKPADANKPASGKKIVVGFAQIGAESEWRTANTKSIKDACEKAGFELKFSDAQQKQENQIKAVRSFIAQKVDYIVLAPVVETGWDTVLKEVAGHSKIL